MRRPVNQAASDYGMSFTVQWTSSDLMKKVGALFSNAIYTIQSWILWRRQKMQDLDRKELLT
jgi:hypothetical protein